MKEFRLEDIPQGRGILTTGRIIVFGLVTGVVLFGAIAAGIVLVKPQAVQNHFPIVSTIMAIVAAITLMMSFFSPKLINSRSGNQTTSKSMESKAAALVLIFFIRTIIGCALCEGGALGNLVAFIIEGQWWSFGIAGVLLLAILSRFPTATGIEIFVKQQMEMAELEQMRGE